MCALICAGIVCAGVAYTSRVWAEPRIDTRAKYERAAQLANSGAPEQALAVIDEGLAVALSPHRARLALDGKAITIEDGGIAVPPGPRHLGRKREGFP